MRYSVYKYIKGLSDSIVEATEYVKGNTKSINLMADCLAAVSAINDVLVKNKMELEEIKEFFSICEKLTEALEKNENYESFIDELLNIAKKINLYCKEKIDYKFKIVFFAELGSKWDSMDSVYRAYKNRKDCEVEVVIAPIFRALKYPNGEVKSDIIYEDFLTPMGISHTSYKDYDIKKDLPDITFTSQPYESVTLEQFWAENIAPYTHLVYLPYFTAGRLADENSIYTQCQMPMHSLAWKVICQSEKAKEVYSKYSQVKGENLLAIGLPKWDWVSNMDKRKIELPKEWEKLKGKRVMLWNIHYSFVDKFDINAPRIRELLKKYNDGNKGIIYRFHPMTDTMFKLYYPQYREEWEKFINEIDNSDNAVVDRNISYEYAFKFSDFLYSSTSSMIYQYAITGKPMVISVLSQENLDNVLINYFDMGNATTPEEVDSFIDKLFNGIDEFKEARLKAVNEGMLNLGMNIGNKLSDVLIKELVSEEI